MDFSLLTVDFTPVFQLAGIIIGGLVALIPVRKAIKLVNRS